MVVNMIPNITQELKWLEKHASILKGINKGLERETLRILPDGTLAKTPFPNKIGSALTHPWITTDFAESMLEFITPVDSNIDHMLAFLRDLHRYSSINIDDELLWPLSMPCFIATEADVMLAQYGSSNQGRYKTVYREGLKNRYGAMMQTISGVHYNFSLPMTFWQVRDGVKDSVSGKEVISEGYFHIIRNYYRFGWVIPFLFGASPSLCSSFFRDPEKAKAFAKQTNGQCYLPYATSLRMSDIGYTNTAQKNLGITFNHLDCYVNSLRQAISTHSPEFSQIGVKVDGHYRQLNDNILQIENEFYAPIRPKRVVQQGETPSAALLRGGIEYIEIRALDINPFSAIGVTEEQIRFLDLFMIWCALADAPEMSSDELQCAKRNWDRVIIEGRKPGLTIGFGCDSYSEPLAQVGKTLFADLLQIADIMDQFESSAKYRMVCEQLILMFDEPSLTLSGRTLQAVMDMGTTKFGLSLAKQYKQQLLSEPMQLLSSGDFIKQRQLSLEKQRQIEAQSSLSFDAYLAKLNQAAKV